MTFKCLEQSFIWKITFLKKFGIQLSCRLKNYISKICQNVQKLDYQRDEGKSIFQIFK